MGPVQSTRTKADIGGGRERNFTAVTARTKQLFLGAGPAAEVIVASQLTDVTNVSLVESVTLIDCGTGGETGCILFLPDPVDSNYTESIEVEGLVKVLQLMLNPDPGNAEVLVIAPPLGPFIMSAETGNTSVTFIYSSSSGWSVQSMGLFIPPLEFVLDSGNETGDKYINGSRYSLFLDVSGACGITPRTAQQGVDPPGLEFRALDAPSSNYNGATVQVTGGYSQASVGGDIAMVAGNTSTGTTGRIRLVSGTATAAGGEAGGMYFYGGDAIDQTGGSLHLNAGESTSGQGGEVYLNGGQSGGSNGGRVTLLGGPCVKNSGADSRGGFIEIEAGGGVGASAIGGDIRVKGGDCSDAGKTAGRCYIIPGANLALVGGASPLPAAANTSFGIDASSGGAAHFVAVQDLQPTITSGTGSVGAVSTSSDMAGNVVVRGTLSGATGRVTVQFRRAYAARPSVVLTQFSTSGLIGTFPNMTAAPRPYVIDDITTTTFSIRVYETDYSTACANDVAFSYTCIGGIF